MILDTPDGIPSDDLLDAVIALGVALDLPVAWLPVIVGYLLATKEGEA